MNKVDLYKGDCLQVMDELIAKGIVVDAIITDPPYGTTACKWDSVIPFDEMWLRLNKLIKPNGAIVLFGSEPFSSLLRVSNLKNFKYDWVWKKEKGTGFATSGKRPLNIIENISVFYLKQPFYNSKGKLLDVPYRHTLPIRKSESGGKSNLSNLSPEGQRIYKEYIHETKTQFLEFSRDNGNKGQHPTQKPVALMKYLIKTYTNKGETILDFTMGSGSTGVAVEELNRDEDLDLSFIGIEMDDKYFDIAENRIKDVELNKGLFSE